MKIQDIILWILFLLSITITIWYLFGNSPSFEQTLIALAITLLFSTGTKVAINSTKISYQGKELSKITSSFIKLSNDFKKHLTKHKLK